MGKFIFQWIIITSFLTFFSGCNKNKCVQHEITDLAFTSSDLSIIPYAVNETLTFKNINGDSFALSIRGRRMDRITSYQINYEEAQMYHDGCQGDYFYSEQEYTDFGPQYTWYFKITLSFDYTLTDPVNDKSLEFNIDSPIQNHNFTTSMVIAHFDADTIYKHYGSNDSVYLFHKSLNLGPKIFDNVYELYLNRETPLTDEWAITLYYSIKNGIVGFKTNLNNTWFLDKTVQ